MNTSPSEAPASDTPRTDAAWVNCGRDMITKYTRADFAKTLERELSTAQRERDELRERLADAQNELDCLKSLRTMPMFEDPL